MLQTLALTLAGWDRYKISYDAKAEMEQAFNSQNVETGNEREQEDVPAPEFNLGVTKDAANRLTKRYTTHTVHA